MSPIRVLVVDDHAVVRSGFQMLLDAQTDIEVVGEAADGAEAVKSVRVLHPDVVLMDIRMPGLDGIEATRQIVALGESAPRVVVLTSYDLDDYAFDALGAGASGFLLKYAPAEEVVSGVRAAAHGDSILAPSVTKRLIEEFTRRRPVTVGDRAALGELTEREREVLILVARGLSNVEIAGRLHVSEGTVKTHVSHLLDKLGQRDRVHAVILAYEVGLVQPGPK